MKKLHTLAAHALIAPAIAFGAATSVLAQSTPMQGSPIQGSGGQPTMQTTTDRQNPGAQAQGYLNAVPAQGILASRLIGTKVHNLNDEDIGSVNNLILDNDGKVAAVVIGVGGFLGMGERDVAVNWGQIVRSGTADKPKLQLNATKESLSNAPEFKKAKN